MRTSYFTPTLVGLFLFLLVVATVAMMISPQHSAAAFLLPGIYLGPHVLGLLVVSLAGDRITPVGSRYSATMRGSSLVLGTPRATLEIPYSVCDHVRAVGDFLLLYRVGFKTAIFLPLALFPAPEFERLADRVAQG